MTVTLDSKTLDCKSLSEGFEIIHIQGDDSENGAYKRKVKVLGVLRTWTLECVESAVAWSSSQAKSFQDTAAAGTTVTFTVTDEVRVIGTTVYILGMTIDAADLAGKNVRRFTLALQEV
jgi:hypothetical protein